jgi:RNA methyltransferase, TrmH family
MKRIESVKNAKVKEWKKLHTKKEREKTGLFIIEGEHLVEEVLKTSVDVEEIIVREGEQLPSHWDIKDYSVIEVTKEVMSSLSDTERPQGFAAICQQQSHQLTLSKLNKVLLLDAVQDPGNIGTMIRTADSAGFDAVVLGEGTVDCYNSKVLRSTQGSLFHIPVVKGNLNEWIENMCNENVPVYGTALEGGTSYTNVEAQKRFALLLGNEGNGVKKELLQKTTQNLYVPIYGNAESLNVSIAAGILMYHLISSY